MLKDTYNRTHDYLRISLIDKCNLRCTYCNPVDLPKRFFEKMPRMTANEIDQIVSVFVKLGVKKIRLTGGEPLVRKDVTEIIHRLSKYPVELAITTNGVFVHEQIDVFKEAGLKSVNVSLDSLSKKNYALITQRDKFDTVMRNIHLLLKNDFQVKVNVVVIKDVNDMEISDFINWSRDLSLEVRFIEFMPFSGNGWSNDKVFSSQQILDRISLSHTFSELVNRPHDTAKKYMVHGYTSTFAVISSMSEPFCSGCNRLRLTSDGKMYNCLFSDKGADLLTALREGKNIESLIHECIQRKFFMQGREDKKENLLKKSYVSDRGMVSIGG